MPNPKKIKSSDKRTVAIEKADEAGLKGEERDNYIKDKYTPDLEEIEEELFARRSAQIIRMNKDIINNAIKSCKKKK